MARKKYEYVPRDPIVPKEPISDRFYVGDNEYAVGDNNWLYVYHKKFKIWGIYSRHAEKHAPGLKKLGKKLKKR